MLTDPTMNACCLRVVILNHHLSAADIAIAQQSIFAKALAQLFLQKKKQKFFLIAPIFNKERTLDNSSSMIHPLITGPTRLPTAYSSSTSQDSKNFMLLSTTDESLQPYRVLPTLDTATTLCPKQRFLRVSLMMAGF